MQKFVDLLKEASTNVIGDIVEMIERDLEESDLRSYHTKLKGLLKQLKSAKEPTSKSIENKVGGLMNDVMDIDWFEDPQSYKLVLSLYQKMVKLVV